MNIEKRNNYIRILFNLGVHDILMENKSYSRRTLELYPSGDRIFPIFPSLALHTHDTRIKTHTVGLGCT